MNTDRHEWGGMEEKEGNEKAQEARGMGSQQIKQIGADEKDGVTGGVPVAPALLTGAGAAGHP